MPESIESLIRQKIRTIPNFPKQGIMFRDITPLLQEPIARDYGILKIK